jgi:hypothetical protein
MVRLMVIVSPPYGCRAGCDGWPENARIVRDARAPREPNCRGGPSVPTDETLLAELLEQEERLQLARFEHDDAFRLGMMLVERARASNHPEFPDGMCDIYKLSGTRHDRLFREPWRGDLRLRPNPDMPPTTRFSWPMPDGTEVKVGGDEHFGAHQGDALWHGPAYRPTLTAEV